MANPINDKYQELRQTEKEVFQAYPLLKVAKPAIQTLAMPAIIAGAATHLPLAGPVVAGAIHQGTDFIQNNLHGLRASQINNHFAGLRDNIQPGILYGMRQRAFDDWATLRSADLLGKSDMLTRPLAGYLAPTAIGKAAMDIAPKVASYVTQLPISKAIGQTIDQTQAMFSNVQAWIDSSRQNIREYGRQAESFVQKEVNKMSNNQDQEQQPQVEKVEASDKQQFDAPQTVVSDADTKLDQPMAAPTQSEPVAQNLRPETDIEEASPSLGQTSTGVGVQAPEQSRESQKQPDKIAQDYFQGLAAELSGRGVDASNMKLFFNNQEALRLKDGQPDTRHTSISNEQMAAFKDALADPKNFKGTIEIRQGDKVLMSVRDGQVWDPTGKMQEALSLSMTAPAESIPETTTQGFYQNASKDVSSYGRKGAIETTQNALKMDLPQSEVKSMLLENDPSVKLEISQHGQEAGAALAQEYIEIAATNNLKAAPEFSQAQTQNQKMEQQQKQTQSQSF